MSLLLEDEQLFTQWRQRNLSIKDTMHELREKWGITKEDAIHSIVDKYKKYCDDCRMQLGFVLAGIGSFLCFISCLLTLLHILPQFRYLILIGLTSVGAILVLVGFYYIFEKETYEEE